MSDGKQLNVVGQALEWAYEKAVDGFGAFGTAEDLGNEYLKANDYSKINAVNSLIRWQNAKAATSGFVTNVGGLITLPVAIPASLASVLYLQLRMIAAIAHIGGHDIKDDRVKTLCYVCLVGNSAGEVLKTAGVQFGEKFTSAAIQKYITRGTILAINKAVGFRLVTKAGTTGIINFTKMVPIIGGIIGGTVDGISTNTVGNTARNTFINSEEDEKPETGPIAEQPDGGGPSHPSSSSSSYAEALLHSDPGPR